MVLEQSVLNFACCNKKTSCCKTFFAGKYKTIEEIKS